VRIDGSQLTIEPVINVARRRERVEVDEATRERMRPLLPRLSGSTTPLPLTGGPEAADRDADSGLDPHCTIHDIVAEGDIVVLRWSQTGTR